MNSILKIAGALAVTCIFCVGAFAQSPDKTKSCCKGKGDQATCCKSSSCKNGEAIAETSVHSDGLSTTISCSCCTQGGASATAPIILALDIDKDGVVSASEIKNATQSLLALDKNRDGRLDRTEMHTNSGFSKVNASTKVKTLTKTKKSVRTSKLLTGGTANYFAQKMLEADTNSDNILSGNEIKSNLQRIMHIVDLNEDGQLTLNELKKLQRSIREYVGDDPNNDPGGGEGG